MQQHVHDELQRIEKYHDVVQVCRQGQHGIWILMQSGPRYNFRPALISTHFLSFQNEYPPLFFRLSCNRESVERFLIHRVVEPKHFTAPVSTASRIAWTSVLLRATSSTYALLKKASDSAKSLQGVPEQSIKVVCYLD